MASLGSTWLGSGRAVFSLGQMLRDGGYSLSCDDRGCVGALEVVTIVSLDEERGSQTQNKALEGKVTREKPARSQHPAKETFKRLILDCKECCEEKEMKTKSLLKDKKLSDARSGKQHTFYLSPRL